MCGNSNLCEDESTQDVALNSATPVLSLQMSDYISSELLLIVLRFIFVSQLASRHDFLSQQGDISRVEHFVKLIRVCARALENVIFEVFFDNFSLSFQDGVFLLDLKASLADLGTIFSMLAFRYVFGYTKLVDPLIK